MPIICQDCGENNSDGMKICGFCGKLLSPPVSAPPPVPDPPEDTSSPTIMSGDARPTLLGGLRYGVGSDSKPFQPKTSGQSAADPSRSGWLKRLFRRS